MLRCVRSCWWCSSTTPWEVVGPPCKELHPVSQHPLSLIWEDDVTLKFLTVNFKEVKWTSIDVVEIGILGEPSVLVILWIGVGLKSLSDGGTSVSLQCWDLLLELGITDVHVEIHESVVTHSAVLHKTMDSYNPTMDVCRSLSTSLGFPLCAQVMPFTQGSSRLFIAKVETNTMKRFLLLTACHVVFWQDENTNNELFVHKNDQPHFDVLLFGNEAFNECCQSTTNKILIEEEVVGRHKRKLRWIEKIDDLGAKKEHQSLLATLNRWQRAWSNSKNSYNGVSNHWATLESCILEHVVLLPPISWF